MSDISALSHDYEATARFAERVNTAVLSLKKSLRQSRGAVRSIAESRSLAEIVHATKSQLEPGAGEATPPVPPEVVQRLSLEHKTRMAYLLEDLAAAETALRGNSPLDSKVVRVLDEICDAADASASAMFRRLRRR